MFIRFHKLDYNQHTVVNNFFSKGLLINVYPFNGKNKLKSNKIYICEVIWSNYVSLIIQAALVIYGLFIRYFAYMRMTFYYFRGMNYPIYQSYWFRYMRICYMRTNFLGHYQSHITRETCIDKDFPKQVFPDILNIMTRGNLLKWNYSHHKFFSPTRN